MSRPSRLAALIALALLVACGVARAQVRAEDIYEFPSSGYHSALIQASDGNFYGTVPYGANVGLVYRLTSDGVITVLHEFTGSPDGANPWAPLVEGPDGLLYGTTVSGGARNYGTVFRMTRDGSVSVIHSFTYGDDGAGPGTGGLTVGNDGNLYGTSYGNCLNANCGGVIFRVTPSGTFTTLHTFRDRCVNVRPRLVQAGDGNFYGTTQCDGGTVFRMTPLGSVTVLHSFAPEGGDGLYPSGVIVGSDGNLYGTTERGGAYFYGTVFKLTLSGTETILHSFGSREVGPMVPPVQGSDGFLYGSTSYSGSYGACGGGILYRLSPGGDFTLMHGFGSFELGGPLIETRDKRLYGVAIPCGYPSNARAFRLPMGPSAEVSVEAPQPASGVAEPFVLNGWALDHSAEFDSGIDAIHVWARPSTGGDAIYVGNAGYGLSRPDIAALFGEQFAASGFGLTVRGLPPGTYEFVATPHSSAWNEFDFSAARSVTLTITSSDTTKPLTTIDAPGSGAILLPRFTVSGWALDLAAPNGSGVDAVHVWAYPVSGAAPSFLGVANYGTTRPDVAANYGTQFANTGYNLLSPPLPLGRYQIVAFARSAVSGIFHNAAAFNVTVSADTLLNIDGPSQGAVVAGPFVVSGWAIDRATASGTGVDAVHLWAFPTSGAAAQFLGAASSFPRPDVAGIYGAQFTNSGYTLTVTALAPGTYDLIVFARSAVTNSFNAARVVRVTIQ